MPPSTVKKLSCRRCRFRKLKCTRTEPCSNCSSTGQKCEYSESDNKRTPVSRGYVADLEEQIARLESLLVRLQAANDMAGVRAILANANVDDHLSRTHMQGQSGVRIKTESDSPVDSNTDTASTEQNYRHSPHLRIESEARSLLCHRPTSIFHFPVVPLPANHDTSECCSISDLPGDHMGNNSQISRVAQHFGINIQERLVNHGLEEFFKWQYPYFMFIYREAFLRDHHFTSLLESHRETRDHNYWSAPLLFAVCALGLLMSTGSQRKASERFFDAAESLLLVTGIAQPCITTVQAFLCLAYYEIGRGNLSKGWGFSGIALRMAQDLGFQRDPYKWQLTNKSITYTHEDMEIRRRIYWGCYISDKFISLTFGRPIFFYDDDAEVELMDRLPDDPNMAKWLPVGLSDEGSADSSTRRSPLIPSFRAQIGLAKVIQHILTKLYTAHQDPDGYIRRKACIDAMELELSRWESTLDDSLRWNQWQPPRTPLIPNVAALHVLFHSLRIILNLEKINMMEVSPTLLDGNNSTAICKNSAQNIISILRKYRSHHGLQHSPLVFIYGAVRAAQAVASFGIRDELVYLLQALNGCSVAWTLAGTLEEKLKSLLRDRFPIQKRPRTDMVIDE